MATEVIVRGVGKSSDYKLDFDGDIVSSRNLNFGDQIATFDRSVATGTVVGGFDAWTGPLPVQVTNRSKPFINTPDIIIEIGDREERISAGETVTFRSQDGGDGDGGDDGTRTGSLSITSYDVTTDVNQAIVNVTVENGRSDFSSFELVTSVDGEQVDVTGDVLSAGESKRYRISLGFDVPAGETMSAEVCSIVNLFSGL